MSGKEPDCWPAEPQLLDAFDTAVLVADVDGRIEHANATALRLYGAPEGGGLVGERLSTGLCDGPAREALDEIVREVLAGRSWKGPLVVRRPRHAGHRIELTCSPLWREQAVVGLICVLEDGATARGLGREDRRLGDRLTRLARVTAELVAAHSVETVTETVVSHAADAVGATLASLTLREGTDSLRLVGLRGGREGEQQQWATYPIATRSPASDAVLSGEHVVLTGAAAIAEAYPGLEALDRGERSLICLPLNAGLRTIGAIGLSFPGLRTLDSVELDFLEVLADTCAQALERIQAQEVAAKQSAQLSFLADASTELASSLDYQATLSKVAQLAVPTLADWCAIDVVVDGRLHRIAVEHVDPAKVQLAHDLAERYPSDPDAPTGAWNVMRTGRSELIPEVTDEMLEAAAIDEEHMRIARELHLRSALTVPLVARGRVLGVLTWVMAESERRYTVEDLAMAEDLGRRAAIAIDNSELHSETLAAAIQLQHAVLPDELPDMPGWETAHHYSPSGRTEVGGDFYDAVPLSDGRVILFVGDVMGRGVAAAAAMAQMRAAVRAYAAVDPTPDVVMAKLDLMFAQYPIDQIVTLVYLVVDPSRDELVVTNAGHPPPVILRADLSTEQLPLAEGPPLGALPEDRWQVVVPFYPGDTVLAFTDGLIERRDEDINSGQDRVLHELPSLARPDLAGALDEAVKRLRDPSRDDDLAVLAVRRTV